MRQTFEPTSPNQHFFCFVVTEAHIPIMLRAFERDPQQCCTRARAPHIVFVDVSMEILALQVSHPTLLGPFEHCHQRLATSANSVGPNSVGRCCKRLHWASRVFYALGR